MIVAGGLEANNHWSAGSAEQLDKAIALGARIGHRKAAPTIMTRRLDQHLIARLGDVDRYQHRTGSHMLFSGHGRSISR